MNNFGISAATQGTVLFLHEPGMRDRPLSQTSPNLHVNTVSTSRASSCSSTESSRDQSSSNMLEDDPSLRPQNHEDIDNNFGLDGSTEDFLADLTPVALLANLRNYSQ